MKRTLTGGVLVVTLGFVTFWAKPVDAKTIWQPPPKVEWQWELAHPLNVSSVTDMSTNVTAWNGDRPPATDPVLYDIDAIENPAATVAKLHSRGAHVVAYIEVGTAGNYYTAAQEGTLTTYYAQLKAAGVLGRKLSGYPEYFLNINSPKAVAIIESMIRQQVASKRFGAVETDLDETFGNNEGATGFSITRAQEEAYLETLAGYMHGLGLAWIAKNLDDAGIQSFVSDLEPYAQGVISEQSNQYGTVALLRPFLAAGKPVMNAEYSLPLAQFAPKDIASGISGALFPTTLNGKRIPVW
jgi:hypothetical protein